MTSGKLGFSILELLIVIGIIAALTGLALPYYSDYVAQSKHSIMRANLHAFEKALMEFRSDKGFYPPTEDVQVLVTGRPRYLLDFPVDPRDNAPATWGYNVPAGETHYELDSSYDVYRTPR